VATSQIGLIEPGDAIEIKGRLWTGEGALADGTVFADQVTVTKKGSAVGGAPGEHADAADLGAR
jgi:hypothetical protein